MKSLKKKLPYLSLVLLEIVVILSIYTYSLTYKPHGRMLWQQAAYAKFFHVVLNIQPEEIPGLLEKDLIFQ